MLQQLDIENFAIIPAQTVLFEGGLNVITGETGAGKSIILRALELILGGRARAVDVRHGAVQFELQALFSLAGLTSEDRTGLPDIVRDFLRNDELVIARSGNAQGRGKVYLNGRLASVATLQEITTRLVSICGQSEYVRLLDPAQHMVLVDSFSSELSQLKIRYAKSFGAWKTALSALTERRSLLARAEEERELLEHKVTEIGRVAPTKGMRLELEEAVKRLGSGEKFIEAANSVTAILDDYRGGVVETLTRAVNQIEHLLRIDKKVQNIRDLLASSLAEVQEASSELATYLSEVEIDENALDTARERLAKLARLERKYRLDDEGLLTVWNDCKARLANLPTPADLIRGEEEVAQLRQVVLGDGAALRAARAAVALSLEESISAELAELGMAGAKVIFSLTPNEEPQLSGLDKGEFMLERRGQALPLRAIASGGELSRLTLVLKKILRDTAGINVLVFDEVDTGVSGSVARAMGKKLRELATSSQVICITHLPQVASLAHNHLLVEKNGDVANTNSATVRALTMVERVDEVARMIAGMTITEASRQSARELLQAEF